jgi:hypothetical protein
MFGLCRDLSVNCCLTNGGHYNIFGIKESLGLWIKQTKEVLRTKHIFFHKRKQYFPDSELYPAHQMQDRVRKIKKILRAGENAAMPIEGFRQLSKQRNYYEVEGRRLECLLDSAVGGAKGRYVQAEREVSVQMVKGIKNDTEELIQKKQKSLKDSLFMLQKIERRLLLRGRKIRLLSGGCKEERWKAWFSNFLDVLHLVLDLLNQKIELAVLQVDLKLIKSEPDLAFHHFSSVRYQPGGGWMEQKLFGGFSLEDKKEKQYRQLMSGDLELLDGLLRALQEEEGEIVLQAGALRTSDDIAALMESKIWLVLSKIDLALKQAEHEKAGHDRKESCDNREIISMRGDVFYFLACQAYRSVEFKREEGAVAVQPMLPSQVCHGEINRHLVSVVNFGNPCPPKQTLTPTPGSAFS